MGLREARIFVSYLKIDAHQRVTGIIHCPMSVYGGRFNLPPRQPKWLAGYLELYVGEWITLEIDAANAVHYINTIDGMTDLSAYWA